MIYSHLSNRAVVWKMDALEWLKGLASASVDLVITDPPYPSLDHHRSYGTTTRLKDWFPTVPNEYIAEAIGELYRVLKKDSHAYIMADAATIQWLLVSRAFEPFTLHKWLTWNKVRRGMGYNYAGQCEYILYLKKGKRKLNTRKHTDLITASAMTKRSKAWTYPSQKPSAVFEPLIENSSDVGEIVCDPFFGSGVVADVAVKMGRRFIGCDSEQRAHDALTARLSALDF